MDFEADFDSLRQFQCPEWYRDAKFGIWAHWGPQCVPMFGDWYARNMYIQDSEQYLYHLRHYGHPSKFGYKDICALWKAENFDPEGLMKRYREAGAKFFMAQASHHDHFFNYASKLNRFNSVDVGPHKDICGLWKAAAEKEGMHFGITEHLGASFSWWSTNKGADSYGRYAGVPYDGNDPEFRDFYHNNYEHAKPRTPNERWKWLTGNVEFREYWLNVMKEIVDLYTPDVLYSDSGLPFGEVYDEHPTDDYRYGLEAVAYLYNNSIANHGSNRAVYMQKNRNPEIYQVGVLDIERSQLPEVADAPWQAETCIGEWFYNARVKYKTPAHVIDILVDTISKNGTMLLNILQKPDGTIDEQTDWLLEELKKWFAVNGEAVYGTRPWRVAAEGPSGVLIDGMKEEKVSWQPNDFRFVQKEGRIFAFVMAPAPAQSVVIRSLADGERVKRVRLLGCGEMPFEQFGGVLVVKMPEKLPTDYACALEISL